jgi:hypothetical protein
MKDQSTEYQTEAEPWGEEREQGGGAEDCEDAQ